MDNTQTNRIAILDASPKVGGSSASALFANKAEERMLAKGITVFRANVRASLSKGSTKEDFAELRQADAILVIMPLYIFCLPGVLMRYLQDYENSLKEEPSVKSPKLYAVVNCGFPEANINEEAARVIQSFSRAIGGRWGFAVLIGEGGMVVAAQQAPFMLKMFDALGQNFDRMAEDIDTDTSRPNVSLPPPFPRRLYLMSGNMNWKQEVRKAGLKKNELYAKPYER